MIKNKYIYLILFLITVIIISLFYDYKNKQNFDTINSQLTKASGFFSNFFFTLNHYIYCKKNLKNFKLDSNTWTYKFKDGWEDYFLPIELKYNEGEEIKSAGWIDVLDNYSIKEYEIIIPEVYRYNEKTQKSIDLYKNKLNLVKYNYDFIYIRRGDKVTTGESTYIESVKFIDKLLEKNPNCKTIFLQTDDYSSYLEMIDYIKLKKLDIKIYTNSEEKNTGAIQNDIQKMNSEEIYNHTIDVLSSIDISKYANFCIIDFRSNVSRFIKLFNENPENVYDINDSIVDYNNIVCPAFSF